MQEEADGEAALENLLNPAPMLQAFKLGPIEVGRDRVNVYAAVGELARAKLMGLHSKRTLSWTIQDGCLLEWAGARAGARARQVDRG